MSLKKKVWVGFLSLKGRGKAFLSTCFKEGMSLSLLYTVDSYYLLSLHFKAAMNTELGNAEPCS